MIRFQIQVFLLFTLATNITKCTIAGISYMDPLNFRPLPDKEKDDACNPLYWYPRAIPEYCYRRSTPSPFKQYQKPPDDVVPLPIPVPLPPNPPSFPFLPPMPQVLPPPPQPLPMMLPPPVPAIPAIPASVPFGVPLIPSNPMLPVPGVPYPYPYPPYPQPHYPSLGPPPPQIGMVPGIKGLVSEDGGINILPFSDVYSNLLEKQKNKIMRKRLRELLGDYHRYPRRRKHKRRYF